MKELRRVALALAMAVALAAGVSAYEDARFADCIATCGPCTVAALNCDSCNSGGGENSCFAEGTGCSEVTCDCGGDPGWECEYYEYETN